MIDRIKSIMDYYQLTPAQFADKIGFQRSALSHVLSGRNNPSLDFVLKVKMAFSAISLDWLTLGTGNQFTGVVNNAGTEAIVKETNFEKDDVVGNQLSISEKSDTPEEKTFSKNQIQPGPKLAKNKEYKDLGQEKQIRKIILLYDDGSFSEHIPEK